MADPLSAVASIAGIIAFSVKLLHLVDTLHQDFSGSSVSDKVFAWSLQLQYLHSILSRLKVLLEAEAKGGGVGESSTIHVEEKDLLGDLEKITRDCADGLNEVEKLLESIMSSGSTITRKFKWIAKKVELERERVALEARKASLNIALSLINNIVTSKIYDNTCELRQSYTSIDRKAEEIHEGTMNVKEMVIQLLENLDDRDFDELSTIVKARSAVSSFALKRYLESSSQASGLSSPTQTLRLSNDTSSSTLILDSIAENLSEQNDMDYVTAQPSSKRKRRLQIQRVNADSNSNTPLPRASHVPRIKKSSNTDGGRHGVSKEYGSLQSKIVVDDSVDVIMDTGSGARDETDSLNLFEFGLPPLSQFLELVDLHKSHLKSEDHDTSENIASIGFV